MSYGCKQTPTKMYIKCYTLGRMKPCPEEGIRYKLKW